jgi:transposase-like protein
MKIMKDALGSITMEVGSKWLGDETILKVNGKAKYLWNVLDFETRCHIVSILTEGRGAKEALMVIETAIKKTGKEPRQFLTDGLQSYKKAFAELHSPNIMHISNVGLANQENNNNRIERLHGTVKCWVKPQRGLKDNVQELIEVHRLYYNLVRPHMALQDKTPVKTDKDGRWISFLTSKD